MPLGVAGCTTLEEQLHLFINEICATFLVSWLDARVVQVTSKLNSENGTQKIEDTMSQNGGGNVSKSRPCCLRIDDTMSQNDCFSLVKIEGIAPKSTA